MTAPRPLRIAWFSPLPPRRTGVADYSLTLLRELAPRPELEIDLWIDSGGVAAEVQVLGLELRNYSGVGEPLDALESYDLVVYQMGNNVENHRAIYDVAIRYPGLLVLHDFVLHHMLARLFLKLRRDPEGYVAEMTSAHGASAGALAAEVVAGRAPRPWESDAVLEYPLNASMVRRARGVLVHSTFAETRLRRDHPDVPVRKVAIPVATEEAADPTETRARLGVSSDTFLVGSFGFMTPPKRIPSLLRAVASLAAEHPVQCVLVGEVQDASISDTIAALGLEGRVRVEGFLPAPHMRDWLSACDVCVNLRHPTSGEASASVLEILSAAKPCLVSDVAWFGELPEGVVIRVPADDQEVPVLCARLRELAADPERRRGIGERASAYVREHHDVKRVAETYLEILREEAAR